MNITDVDDKLFNRAKELGTDPVALARHYEREFWHDMEALHVQRPDVVVRVTESVSDIIVPYIEKIINNGMAYVAQDQSVYFDVRAFEDRTQARTRYGKLAPPQNSSDFFSSVREESTKRDTRDFVLWKPRKEGESVSWDSPWGPGRPGWHIECSAMIESIAKQVCSSCNILNSTFHPCKWFLLFMFRIQNTYRLFQFAGVPICNSFKRRTKFECMPVE
jgi:cysteinyl-tRNA synthetase